MKKYAVICGKHEIPVNEYDEINNAGDRLRDEIRVSDLH